MNEMIAQLRRLKTRAAGYWAERILAELEFAAELSRVHGRSHDALLRSAIAALDAEAEEAGAVTRELAEETERKLDSLALEAKAYTLLCAAHAHIDMNWQWRYDETVAVTLDTLRTVLDLMREYPGFCFSQSQASVYRIVEEYDPEMLKEIRRRVREGRWEVTASTWVEADKNLSCGESLARQILYTRRYLARLLELDGDDVLIDFEPDTFGHSRTVPEILIRGGVRRYYHCRGYDEHTLYRWRAPSGAEVLAYRDPFWYLAEVSASMAVPVPGFCHRHGMDTMVRAYGVGDHGGGPTRRDLERILDMDGWPVFPRVRFGTWDGFFTLAEKVRDRLPVVDRELNVIFSGCFTSQSRIKAANRIAEARLAEAEAFSAAAALAAGAPYRTEVFGRAWEKVLFNQFHDILPGSGVVDTREYALGQFQQAMAAATSEQALALRRIAAQVGTMDLVPAREGEAAAPGAGSRADTSEGAGAGWGVGAFRVSAVARGGGHTRVFHVFNALAHPRTGTAELVLWDWDGDPKRLVVTDAAGAALEHQLVSADAQKPVAPHEYWGHGYLRVIVTMRVPALGYTTCTVSEAAPIEVDTPLPADPRVERPETFLLENEHLRVQFDPVTCAVRSIVEKSSGEELVGGPGAGFRRVDEDDTKGSTAWTVGRWMRVRDLRDNVRVAPPGPTSGPVRRSLRYEIRFDASTIKAEVSLDAARPVLRWDVECEWLEVGRRDSGVPQLNFHLPLAFECRSCRYDVPFGTVERAAAAQDVPASSWAAAVPKKAGRRAVMLVAGQRHGFRCSDDSLSLTLLRSSYDPDPFPEVGVHRFDFGIVLAARGSSAGLCRAAAEYCHGFSVLSGAPHPGPLPGTGSFAELEQGPVVLAAAKMAEDGGRRLVLRLCEADGKDAVAAIRFQTRPAAAWLADLSERRLADAPSVSINGPTVRVPVAPHAVATLVVEFADADESPP